MRNRNPWLDNKAHDEALNEATGADITRIRQDDLRLEIVSEAEYDAGFEAGVLASEAGLGRYSD